MTLMLPWLETDEQPALFPRGLSFDRPSLQEQYSRWWLLNRANLDVRPRDMGETWARYGRDMGEIWARCGRDVGEI